MYFLTTFLIFSFCSSILADNSCRFVHPTKGVIDLTTIGLRNGRARFPDVPSSSSSYYTYSFNPCYSFMEGACQDAAVCQITSDGSYAFTLAKQNLSSWSIDSDNTAVLTYTDGIKTVAISMICSSSQENELEVLAENPANYYSMRLRSHCACWNGCKTPSTTATTSQPTTSTTSAIYSNACMYHDSRYGTIDLSSIGSMNGIPAFQDVQSIYPNNHLWSYNPCYQFSEDSCQNVSGCQFDRTRGISYTIGLQDYAYWINMNPQDNPLPSIVYPTLSMNRRLTVQLVCNRSSSSHHLQVIGETSPGEYTMQLTGRCACWNGCTHHHPPRHPFNWNFWLITYNVCVVVFLLFCVTVTCLFCSKPKRNHRVMIVDEKTPFIKGSINEYGV